MTHENHGATFASDVTHFSEAFFLKANVTDGKNLVDQQNFGLEVRGNGECQADVHSAGIVLHRRVDELFQLCEGDDLVKLSGDLFFAHAQDGTAQEGVLASSKLRMETGAHFQKTADAATNFCPACCWPGDARKDFEEGSFA